MKRLCASLLILLSVVPAVSVRDDEIFVSRFLFNADPYDDSMAPASHLSKADFDWDIATLLDQIDYVQIAKVFVLHFDPATNKLHFILTTVSRERPGIAPTSRAPPAQT